MQLKLVRIVTFMNFHLHEFSGGGGGGGGAVSQLKDECFKKWLAKSPNTLKDDINEFFLTAGKVRGEVHGGT